MQRFKEGEWFSRNKENHEKSECIVISHVFSVVFFIPSRKLNFCAEKLQNLILFVY